VPRQARQDHATIEHPFSFHERRALPLTAGARVGPYELLSRIGAGGMGEVFRGRDTRLDRLVAIKLLSPAPDVTPKQLERFHLEARAISRVSHPNICALYDVGQQDGVPFLVMELLEGQTLANRLESGPMPIDRALEIGAQIADALDAAHGHGITHRDLKPGNIMVTREGVKLLDFGIAKLRDADEGAAQTTESISLTDEGAMIGTLPYMAPEQLEGREADWRADIFALGASSSR
jgi:eukaryotic-like serine/threonine-protein kinase